MLEESALFEFDVGLHLDPEKVQIMIAQQEAYAGDLAREKRSGLANDPAHRTKWEEDVRAEGAYRILRLMRDEAAKHGIDVVVAKPEDQSMASPALTASFSSTTSSASTSLGRAEGRKRQRMMILDDGISQMMSDIVRKTCLTSPPPSCSSSSGEDSD